MLEISKFMDFLSIVVRLWDSLPARWAFHANIHPFLQTDDMEAMVARRPHILLAEFVGCILLSSWLRWRLFGSTNTRLVVKLWGRVGFFIIQINDILRLADQLRVIYR